MLTPVERSLLIWILELGAILLMGLRLHVHHRGGWNRNIVLTISDALLLFVLLLYTGVAISMEIKLAILRAHPEKLYTTRILAFGPAQGVSYVTILWLCKSSFLLFYLSMKRHMTPTYRVLLAMGTFVIVGTFIMNFLIQFVWCRPFKTMVNFGLDYCSANVEAVPAILLVASNITTDAIVMLLGLFLIRNLQLGRRQKMALVFIIIVGSIPIIASAVRYSNVRTIITDTNKERVRHSLFNVELWSLLDGNFAIYTTCLPALRAFLRSREPRTTVSGSGGTGKKLKSLWSSVVSTTTYSKSEQDTEMALDTANEGWSSKTNLPGNASHSYGWERGNSAGEN
ncbi:hypothetical protein EDC01DRAFT_645518 [Geopyxis carbonaria]|nr:hypothetical protein EDC01DRAFT_645518 [Geopyxis carbonaria]